MSLRKWRLSKLALLFVTVVILGTHFLYYPKWKQSKTEATLSWDVSGYYMYLPAMFIYKDLKQCNFLDEVLDKYKPTPDPQQVIIHKASGNTVMKYSIGQAIQFSPFFLIAHTWASNSSSYPADGFSLPYQLLISLGSLFFAILGLYYLRKILLFYFEERAVALTLIGLVLGSNYLNYAAIDGAMTHNHLFTIYTLLIYHTIIFYRRPSYLRALAIGILVGLAALTRPTEMIALIIPVLWGLQGLNLKSLVAHFNFLKTHIYKILLAILICAMIGSIQLIYWKYVSGDWIVYSYEDQGFSWLRPHFYDGLLSFKSGWLTYSPFMVFALLGFFGLFKKRAHFFTACAVFASVFMYLTFAWDIWWYGGSLGQRSMVQCYPILAFPLAAFFAWLMSTAKVLRYLTSALVLVTCFLSLNFTHHAHYGGALKVGQMTSAYYWKTLGRLKSDRIDEKLLDTDEMYDGGRKDWSLDHSNDRYFVMDADQQYAKLLDTIFAADAEWIKVSADFFQGEKEWTHWNMTQLIVKLKLDDQIIKERMIRVQRHLDPNQLQRISIEMTPPSDTVNNIEILCWNAASRKRIEVSKLRVETLP